MFLGILPERWTKTKERWKAICIAVGYDLLQHDRAAEAWRLFERVLRIGKPSIDDSLNSAMCLYHGLGRFHDALALLARANNLGIKEASERGLTKGRYRVLDPVWARHIGHTATIDYVIKLGILEGRKRDDTILYLPLTSPVANKFLLRQVAEQLRLIENSTDLPFDESALQALHYDYLAPLLSDGTTAYFWEVAAKTYRQWHEDGRAPLFALPSEVEERGWAALDKMKVARGAWFVALHVRQGTWDGRNPGLHGILNANIQTFLPAIGEITRRGGWVIRMGDASMIPLPQMPNVLDYCHSDLRADWMDVFLAARCRFMLGTSSGPAYLPALYGVPSVLTNWWPPAQRPWHPTDLFIPKMLRRIDDGRYLTLRETLAEPFSFCHSRNYLASAERVRVDDNDPEMIRAVTIEMLERLDGRAPAEPDVETLHNVVDQTYAACGVHGMGRLAADFVKLHASLLQ